MREVTERDLRMPEFINAKPEDLEFRDDGKIVRKDRWETGVRNIASALGWARKEFEIPDVVAEVKRVIEVAEAAIGWQPINTAPDDGEFLAAIEVHGSEGRKWWERHVIRRDDEDASRVHHACVNGWDLIEDYSHWTHLPPAPESGVKDGSAA